MFSKIDKKVLTISVIVLILALLVGFAAYKYLTSSWQNSVENKVGGAQTQSSQSIGAANNSQNPQETVIPGVKVETEGTGHATLSVCVVKCGDGICEKVDNDCVKNNTNCICPETPQNCPQDCQ